MSFVHICIELDFTRDCLLDDNERESYYQTLFKPLLTFLFSHPKCQMGFCLDEGYLFFLKKIHPEALELFSELTNRKQIEMLGGACYSPILPFLFSQDKSAQIERMTTSIRNAVGKRPRGMSIFASFWEPSLVSVLQSCGMEYVHLDSSLIPPTVFSDNTFKGCYIMSEQGKSIKVLPFYDMYKPLYNEDFTAWVYRIEKEVREEDSVISLCFSAREMIFNIEKGFFYFWENFSDPNFVFSNAQAHIKSTYIYKPVYIPAGMEKLVSRWIVSPYHIKEYTGAFPLTVYDFLNSYPLAKKLYQRILYVSLLISQAQGADKERKKAAREKLMKAEAGENFIDIQTGLVSLPEKMQEAYVYLNKAELLLRSSYDFSETVTVFDYNGDGLNEYVCRMNNFSGVISPLGAEITELNLMSSGKNYATSLNRVEDFDLISDNYERGLFVEHLFEDTSLVNRDRTFLLNKENLSDQDFSRTIFKERKFKRKEIQLEGEILFSSKKIPVKLRKNYTVTPNGLIVQYILINEGEEEIKGIFVTELNIAQTDFASNSNQYDCAAIYNGTKQKIPLESSFYLPCFKDGDGKDGFNVLSENILSAEGVSLLQVVDRPTGVNFLLEPNEGAGLFVSYIPFKRPIDPAGGKEERIEQISYTQVICFHWNVNLSPHGSMEKTIGFSIVPNKGTSSSL